MIVSGTAVIQAPDQKAVIGLLKSTVQNYNK